MRMRDENERVDVCIKNITMERRRHVSVRWEISYFAK
jgi:hypothetical protein